MSSGDKTSTTVQNDAPPEWATGSFQDLLGKAGQISNQPYQAYPDPRIAGFSDDQLAGFDQVRNVAQGGNPTLAQGNQSLQEMMQSGGANPYIGQGVTTSHNPLQNATTDVGTNQYAGANPYLNQMIGSAQGDVVERFNEVATPNLLSQFQQGGAFGGSAMQNAMTDQQQVLGDQLGDISMGLRSQDYDRQVGLRENDINRRLQANQADTDRQAGLSESYINRVDSLRENNLNRNAGLAESQQSRRLSALGMLPQYQGMRYDDSRALMNIGQQQQNLLQGVYDTGHQNYLDQRDYPAQQLGVLANALGSIQGGSSTQTGANPNYKSAGQNAAGYAALLASMWGS